jgi:hypothetical protein
MTIGFSFATTALSIWTTYVETQRGTVWSDDYAQSWAWNFSANFLVVFPAVAGLAMQLL